MRTRFSSFQRQAWGGGSRRQNDRQTSIQTVLLVAALATARQVVIGRQTVGAAPPSVWEHLRMASVAMVVLSPIYGLIAWGVSGSVGVAALALLAILAAHTIYEVVRVSIYALLYPTSEQLGQPSWPSAQAAVEIEPDGTVTTEELNTLICIESAPDPDLDPRQLTLSRPQDLDEVVQEVDQALRHLADYAWLGDSPLVGRLGLAGETHIARGKALRARLQTAVEGLRPPGPAPKEPCPREWLGYTTLRLAYVEEVPNRDVMVRLCLAESTFARLRRKAVRAVARSILEQGGLEDFVGQD